MVSSATVRKDFRLKKVDPQNEPLKLCLATHADRYMAAEVPESEVRTFANRNNMNLFRTSNINENVRSNNTIDGASSIKEFVITLEHRFFLDKIIVRHTRAGHEQSKRM